VRDGRGTDACLVGEGSPLQTLDQNADDAATNGLGCKGAFKDDAERRRNLTEVGEQDDQGRTHIDPGHQGHNLLGYLGDGLDTTNDNGTDNGGQDQPKQPTGLGEYPKGIGDHLMGLVALKHIPTAQRAQDAHDGKQHCKHFAEPRLALVCQTLAQVVHGPAGNVAIGKFDTIFDAEGTFGELGGHAKQPGDDHPEGGTGPSQADRNRDTGDIAQPHGTGQGRGQRLEVRHFTGVFGVRIDTAKQFDRVFNSRELD